jgi:hypothetical protein
MDEKERFIRERMLRNARDLQVEAIRQRADRLRRLANEIDHIADRAKVVGTPLFSGFEGANSQVYLAGQVVHEVVQVVPNLNFSALINAAGDIDRQSTEMEIGQSVEPVIARERGKAREAEGS